MSVLWPGRRGAAPLVTLALFLFSAFALELHSGPELLSTDTPDRETVFLSSHSGPEKSTHLDPATGVETRHCPGCLLRLRDRDLAALRLLPSTTHVVRELCPGRTRDPLQALLAPGPSPRAPPLA
jgi:hypothetical protein